MIRTSLSSGVLLLAACLAMAQTPSKAPGNGTETQGPDAPSGRDTYMAYCASCHGENLKGVGSGAKILKTPPPDLTTLAKRHDGKFPYEYVAGVVRFGKPISAHGSADMPVWGPIFSLVDFHEVAIRQRIKNLCDFLASQQEK
jgi:mono/diheme cytochrome c family protein